MTQHNIERRAQPTENRSPKEILTGMQNNRALGKEMKVGDFLDDVHDLDQTGATGIEPVQDLLHQLGQDPLIWKGAIHRLQNSTELGEKALIEYDFKVAEALGMGKLPEVAGLLTHIKTTYLKEDNEAQEQQQTKLHDRWEQYFKTPLAERDETVIQQLYQDTAQLVGSSDDPEGKWYQFLDSFAGEYENIYYGVELAAEQLGLITLTEEDRTHYLEMEGARQEEINRVKTEAEQQRIATEYNSRSAELGLQDVQGGSFLLVDGVKITSLADPEGSIVPTSLESAEADHRLALIGQYNGIDGTLTVVDGGGRYFVGPMTDENIAALEAAGYRRGPVGNIMNADCRFADPEWQKAWEEMLEETNRSATSEPAAESEQSRRSRTILEKEVQNMTKANPKAVADLIRSWLGEKTREEKDVNASLTGAQKAAALLIILGQDRASQVFHLLEEAEIDTVAAEILKLEKLAPSVITELLEESFEGLASRHDEERLTPEPVGPELSGVAVLDDPEKRQQVEAIISQIKALLTESDSSSGPIFKPVEMPAAGDERGQQLWELQKQLSETLNLPDDDSFQTLEEIIRQDGNAPVLVLNNLIDGNRKRGTLEQAMRLLREMFSATAQQTQDAHELEQALDEFLKDVQEQGHASAIHHGKLIDSLADAAGLDRGRCYQSDFQYSSEAHNLASWLGRWEDSGEAKSNDYGVVRAFIDRNRAGIDMVRRTRAWAPTLHRFEQNLATEHGIQITLVGEYGDAILKRITPAESASLSSLEQPAASDKEPKESLAQDLASKLAAFGQQHDLSVQQTLEIWQYADTNKLTPFQALQEMRDKKLL